MCMCLYIYIFLSCSKCNENRTEYDNVVLYSLVNLPCEHSHELPTEISVYFVMCHLTHAQRLILLKGIKF